MNIRAIDLNLIAIAAALYRHKNVSKAAQELGVSQSAVSHALARLRHHFGDPMFVRVSKGVMPTEFARGVQDELLAVVKSSEALFARRNAFDPAKATGLITLATTDYFEAVVLPVLQPLLARLAPLLKLSLRPTVGELPKRELEEGRIDAAVAGFYRDLPEGFYQTRLFTDSLSVAAARTHPGFKGTLDLEKYLSLRHALITLQGDFRDPLAHGSGKKKRAREIAYGSYSFTGMAWLLESSELVLTAPTLLLERYQKNFAISVKPYPTPHDPIEVRMVWHEQTHADPLRAWFREQLKGVCAKVAVSR